MKVTIRMCLALNALGFVLNAGILLWMDDASWINGVACGIALASTVFIWETRDLV